MNKPARAIEDMTKIQQEAFGLAVAYDAYQDALRVPADHRTYSDWNSIAVWGTSLIRAQAFFGIEIIPKVSVESIVLQARKAKEVITAMQGPAVPTAENSF